MKIVAASTGTPAADVTLPVSVVGSWAEAGVVAIKAPIAHADS
jgi:hypothetical protein